jgi:hypothetical protein
MRFVIVGPPRTKKTSNRIVRVGRFRKILPSEAHERWFKTALPQARIHAARMRLAAGDDYEPYEPVNVKATFYRDAERGDAVGYYQALADLLERSGIVKNDRLIRSWDGSRLAVDKRDPRIEFEITPAQGTRGK